jgi:formamidopyrimidine-DNA glycosylase
MPELPDITIYIEALERRVVGQILNRVRVTSPFLLRTAVPPLASLNGRKVIGLRRVGKRIAFGFENELWLVLHLMIAGPGRIGGFGFLIRSFFDGVDKAQSYA